MHGKKRSWLAPLSRRYRCVSYFYAHFCFSAFVYFFPFKESKPESWAFSPQFLAFLDESGTEWSPDPSYFAFIVRRLVDNILFCLYSCGMTLIKMKFLLNLPHLSLRRNLSHFPFATGALMSFRMLLHMRFT